jgi:hypothetical protein
MLCGPRAQASNTEKFLSLLPLFANLSEYFMLAAIINKFTVQNSIVHRMRSGGFGGSCCRLIDTRKGIEYFNSETLHLVMSNSLVFDLD